MSTDSDSYISFGVGLIFGLSLGAIGGLLAAPKPGEETRQELKETLSKLPEQVLCDETKSHCAFDKLRFKLDRQINNINESVKAGKMAAAKKSEELEDGVTGC